MSATEMRELGQCSSSVALESRFGKAYNEEAFRYLLAIERKRADASCSSIVLVLVRRRQSMNVDRRFSRVVASEVFAAMWLCFREIDFTGWLCQDRVAGAVLTIGAEPLHVDVVSVIDRRIALALRERVLSGGELQVRVRRLCPAGAH